MKSPFRRKTLSVMRDSGSDAFSAEPIDLDSKSSAGYMAAAVKHAVRANRRAWQWYTKIGAIHYAVGRASRIAGYAQLGVYELKADGTVGKKIKSKTGIEAQINAMLASPHGGMRGLIERFFVHMKVPGETWLIRVRDADGDPDGYDFVAAEEWHRDSLASLDPDSDAAKKRLPLKRITQPGNEGREQDVLREDVIGRVWRPSGMFLDIPDSPMYALDDQCEILHLLTRGLKAKLGSKLLMNGTYYIPQEVNEARSGAPTGKPGELHNNKVIDQFLRAAQFAASNPDDPMSSMPVILVGPGDQANNVKFDAPDRQIFQVEMDLRSELLDSILFGLDINPQGVKGTSDANHWGAWAASDDEQRVNVKPDLEVLCWALTRLVLYAEMKAADVADGRIAKRCIWYDISKAVAKTNLAEDARQLSDRVLIGPEATRRMNGVDEDDAPTDLETIRMVGLKCAIPYLALYEMDAAKDIDWDKVQSAKTGPASDSPADESKVGPGKGQPGSPSKSDRKSDTPARKQPG